MKKISRSDLPPFAEGDLSRSARCGVVYTSQEYAAIMAGHLACDLTDVMNIFEEDGRLFFVNRAENRVEYQAFFEERGDQWILTEIRLEDTPASRCAFPGDIDAARMVWMLIEDNLLKRFPEAAWQAHMESFRVTPEVDDPQVPLDSHERAFIFAGRTFFKEHARLWREKDADAAREETPAHRAPRLLAFIIDMTPFLLALIFSQLTRPGAIFLPPLIALFYVSYHTVSLALWGKTLGKRMFGLKVIDARGAHPSWGRASARTFGYLLSSLPFNIGFLWSWGDSQGRAWHDYLAKTWVVQAHPWSAAARRSQTVLAWLAGFAFVNLWLFSLIGVPKYLEATLVAEARNGLRQIAAMEESYHQIHGRYTDDMSQLGSLGGDDSAFAMALLKIFDTQDFKIELTEDGYRIQARALDLRRTLVQHEKGRSRP